MTMNTNTDQKTVLLIEDDVALNRAVKFKLEQKGDKVISVFKAEDALKILKSEQDAIDIVWLDILLPGMNGVSFLEEIRKHEEFKNLKVVICSVSEKEDIRDVVFNLGAVDYLIKSEYGLDVLVNKVLSYA